MSILLAEEKSLIKGVFGKQAGAVEIIKTVFVIIPPSNVPVILQSMSNYPTQLFTRMAVLGSSVTNSDAFFRLGHCPDVERETFRMAACIIPYLIGNDRYISLFYGRALV